MTSSAGGYRWARVDRAGTTTTLGARTTIFTPTRLEATFPIDVERHNDELVAVGLRADSATRNEWLAAELSRQSGRLANVPQGFAQGYQTLEGDAEVLYQTSCHYVPEATRGVRWDNPALGIDWPSAPERMISERDRSWPDLRT